MAPALSGSALRLRALSERPTSRWLLIYAGFALLALALLPPGNVSSDGGSMLAVADSLATHQSFAVSCHDYGYHGRGGQCFSNYYPLQSILAAPLVLVGRTLASAAGTSETYVGSFVAHVVPAVSAAGVATFTVFFAQQWGASRRRALLAGLTVVFATELAVYFRTFFAESLATLLVCVVAFGLMQTDRRRRLAPIATVLLILAKPQLVLVAPAIALVFYRHRRDPEILWSILAATVIGAALYGGYNLLRWDDAFNMGGDTRTLHSHNAGPLLVLKAFGLLTISPGRGFLIYSPITILGLWAIIRRRELTLPRVALAVAVAVLAVHVLNPGVGSNWGSRYLVPLLPFFVAAAWAYAPAPSWLAPALAILGVVIVLPTFVGVYQRYYHEQGQRGHPQTDLYWTPDKAPIVGVWGSTGRQVREATHTDARAVASSTTTDSQDNPNFYRVVNQWWWMTPTAHVPWPVGLLVAAAAFGGGAVLLRRGAGRLAVTQRSDGRVVIAG